MPRAGRAPYPAVLGAAGHTDASKAEPNFQRVWISLAKRGFVVIAFDPPAQGERIIHYNPTTKKPRAGIASGEHTSVGLQCLLTGSTVARYFVWDAMRALDYLLTRTDVDPRRIAITGVSGGGMQSAYMALLEPRLAAAGPACWMTSTEKWFTQLGPQDGEQNVFPLLTSGLGVEDFPLGFAPRPFSYFTATRDFFPIAGAHAAFAESRRIYGVFGSPGRVELHEYDDQHSWSKPRREATYRWLQKVLNNRADDSGAEGEIPVEPVAALNCTPTGQLATSMPGEDAFTANLTLAERLSRERRPLDPDMLESALRAKLAFRRLPRPEVEHRGALERAGYRLEKLVLKTEPGILVPALLAVPPGAKRVLIYVHAMGKSAAIAEIEALARSGSMVLAPDLRGMGESAPSAEGPTEGHTARYRTAMRALHVARPLAGMQTADLLACFDYLSVRAQNIAVTGKGNAGVIALYAALLEPRIS
jgi:dienelactone hydrolase